MFILSPQGALVFIPKYILFLSKSKRFIDIILCLKIESAKVDL